MARQFRVGVGGKVTWQFSRLAPSGKSLPAGRSTFVVTAIVDVPPVLVDKFDESSTAVLPPAATARYLHGEFTFGWIGLRLTAGTAGIPALQAELGRLARAEARAVDAPGLVFSVRRMDIVHNEVQQAIRPQAVFGGLAALAMLVLAGQGLTPMLSRTAGETAVLRAVGATRGQAAVAAGLQGA
jgi:hypothetical protein